MSGFGTCGTPEKLKELLQTMLDRRCLPVHKGKLALKLIKSKYGQHYSLSNYRGLKKHQWAKEVIDEFKTELIAKEGQIAGINLKYGTPTRLKNC